MHQRRNRLCLDQSHKEALAQEQTAHHKCADSDELDCRLFMDALAFVRAGLLLRGAGLLKFGVMLRLSVDWRLCWVFL